MRWLVPLLLICLIAFAAAPPRPAHAAAPPREARKDHYGDPLPAGAVARLGTLRYRVPDFQAIGLGFTPDGERLVSATQQSVEVIESKTGKPARSIGLNFSAQSFALSRDGKRAAVVGFRYLDGQDYQYPVRVVNVADGKTVRSWSRGKEHGDNSMLAFSPDGKFLASLTTSGLFRLEDIRVGDELLRHRFAARATGLAFAPDGATIAVAARGKVHIWRWKEGGEPAAFEVPPRWAEGLAFSPDGKTLVTGDEGDAGVRLWEVATGKKVRTLGAGRASMMAVLYSPDGKYVVGSSYKDRALILWDARSGEEVRRLPCRERHIKRIAFSRDSRRLAAAEECVIRVWDVASGKDLADVASHSRALNFVQLLKGDVAVTAANDGTVRFWDARTGRQTKRIDTGYDGLSGSAVSPDGRLLATSHLGSEHAVILWDLKSGKRVYRLPGHGRWGGPVALGFSKDGKQLASWGPDQYLRRSDVKKGKAIEEYAVKPDGKGGPLDDGGPDEVRLMQRRFFFSRTALSGDVALFAMPFEGGVYVFDVASGKQKAQLKNEDGRVAGLAFSPDKKALLVAARGRGRLENAPGGGQRVVNDDHAVTLFDLDSGMVRKRVAFPGETPDHAAFRPDGKGFAVAFTWPKPLVRFFDAEGKPAGKIDLETWPQALAYSPDGRRILVGLADTTALIYDIPAR